MTDFERRLRAAMAAAAEPAPAGLLDGIHRRHRRHVRRVATACVAVVAVGVAGTLVTRGILAAGPAGRGPGGTGPAATGPAVSPAAVPSSTATARAGHRAPGLPVQQLRDAGLRLESPQRARGPGLVHLRPPRQHSRPRPPAAHREDPCLGHDHRGPRTATRPWSRRPPRSAGGSGSWPASTTAGRRTPCPRAPRVSPWPAARPARPGPISRRATRPG